MTLPVLIDLFCCEGGASVGYARAGFRVIGVDIDGKALDRYQCYRRKDLVPFEHKNERAFADALGCDWMTARGGRQAIPPAMTEHIGRQMLAAISAGVAA